MLNRDSLSRGFTLIEVLVAVSIFAILLGVGVPALSVWIERAGVQTITENLQNGLRVAQQEAIKRNELVDFVLISTSAAAATGTTGPASSTNNWTAWAIQIPGNASLFRSEEIARDRAGTTTIFASAATSINRLRFSGLGRVFDATGTNLANPAVFRIASVGGSRTRCVYVTPGAAIKVCDPMLAVANPAACAAPITAACLAAN